ncbi:PQQ-dependent sugar dehydrogenase [Kribbella sp. NPDC056861]|uniref:PQQ-dependent sugar dehydrogenase n=1 Tax=Kribbella sp. NPDC056861 TaxID=3154857 RepID=UPI0034255E58
MTNEASHPSTRRLRKGGPNRQLRPVGVLLLVAAMIGTFLIFSGPATAAIGNPVVGAGSGLCLDVKDASTTPGTPIQIWTCHAGSHQSWDFTAAGEMRTFDGTRCLDAKAGGTTAPTAVSSYTCHGGTNQKFRLNANGTITATNSGLCLDVVAAGTAPGSVVQLWTCNGGSNQRWTQGGADSQAPTAPGNARTSNLTCNSVTLAWNASTDNVGVTSYDIYHDGQLMKSVSGSTVSTQLSVVANATWGLYVNARDAAGNVSQASNTATIAIPPCQADNQPPTAPGGLTGTASGTTVNLRWTASTDNVGVTGYDIFRGTAKAGSVSGTTTIFADSGLAANTRYEYYVVARDAQSNVSPRSNLVAVTTGASCGSAICSVSQLATDNDIPWGVTTLPDGQLLYSRRDAQNIVRLDPANGSKTSIGQVPNVQSTDGEGGLLGIAIAPNFSSDPWLYVMHTSPTDNRVVRIRYLNGLLSGSPQVLVNGIARNKFHNGGRLRFGPDGKLYVSTGDGQNGDWAQDLNNLSGKILRINADGSVPSDNPFGNRVWSYGHRNPQGLAFDSQGRLWEQEFGNAVMDETNIIVKGGNYGWPSCEGTSGTCGTAGFRAPIRTYPTAEGSCSGIAIVQDVLYISCLRGSRLYRATISGGGLTNVQSLLAGTYGRLRTVEPAPGGGLWLTTSNNGDKDSVPNNSNERIFRVALG